MGDAVTYPLVADVSNYDADTFDAECFKAAGIAGVIIGCQRPYAANAMARKAKDAGLPILGVYAFLYFGIDTIGQTGRAIDVAHEFDVPMVWLDCESATPHEAADATTVSRRVELAHCVDMVERDLQCGIYTGRYWWPSKMATDEFAHLPLWLADYGRNDGSRAPLLTTNFGGWTKVAIHQYTSTYDLCGRGRDMNYLLTEEEDMTPTQAKMLSDVWLACTGGDAAILANFNANPGNSLIALALATNQRIAEHEVRPHAGSAHEHEATVRLT